MEALGRQVILEYYGCDADLLDDCEFIEELLVGAAEHMRATVVDSRCHRFNPHGVSGVVVISESHLTVHTWPEYGYAAIDVFTCGEVVDPWQAHRYLAERLQPDSDSVMELKRGCLDVPPGTLPAQYDVAPDESAPVAEDEPS